MPDPSRTGSKHFTAFRSAAEEVASSASRLGSSDPRGAHSNARAGRIVLAAGSEQPYKVVLEYESGPCTEHGCSTVREGEAFIRQNTATPVGRDSSRDQEPGAA